MGQKHTVKWLILMRRRAGARQRWSHAYQAMRNTLCPLLQTYQKIFDFLRVTHGQSEQYEWHSLDDVLYLICAADRAAELHMKYPSKVFILKFRKPQIHIAQLL